MSGPCCGMVEGALGAGAQPFLYAFQIGCFAGLLIAKLASLRPCPKQAVCSSFWKFWFAHQEVKTESCERSLTQGHRLTPCVRVCLRSAILMQQKTPCNFFLCRVKVSKGEKLKSG